MMIIIGINFLLVLSTCASPVLDGYLIESLKLSNSAVLDLFEKTLTPEKLTRGATSTDGTFRKLFNFGSPSKVPFDCRQNFLDYRCLNNQFSQKTQKSTIMSRTPSFSSCYPGSQNPLCIDMFKSSYPSIKEKVDTSNPLDTTYRGPLFCYPGATAPECSSKLSSDNFKQESPSNFTSNSTFLISKLLSTKSDSNQTEKSPSNDCTDSNCLSKVIKEHNITLPIQKLLRNFCSGRNCSSKSNNNSFLVDNVNNVKSSNKSIADFNKKNGTNIIKNRVNLGVTGLNTKPKFTITSIKSPANNSSEKIVLKRSSHLISTKNSTKTTIIVNRNSFNISKVFGNDSKCLDGKNCTLQHHSTGKLQRKIIFSSDVLNGIAANSKTLPTSTDSNSCKLLKIESRNNSPLMKKLITGSSISNTNNLNFNCTTKLLNITVPVNNTKKNLTLVHNEQVSNSSILIDANSKLKNPCIPNLSNQNCTDINYKKYEQITDSPIKRIFCSLGSINPLCKKLFNSTLTIK